MNKEKVSIQFKTRTAEKEQPVVIGGRYALQKELGRGGVGEVFLARDLQLQRMVAVKRVYVQMGEAASRAEFALAEARRLACLQHPNIVTVFDVLDHQGDVHMVMEYLSGLTLEDLEAPLTLEDFLNVARQTLGGLAAAHALGMIHLDIKSTNLMLTWLATGQLQVKLLDFGLATMLEQAARQNEDDGSVFGSVYTMAPEQLERRPVDVRTDLYSLGCVFYHALTRKDPFRGPTVEAIIDAHLQHDVRPLASRRPDLPPGVSDWVETMMARDPGDRPESAATALSLLLSSLSGSAAANVRSSSRTGPDALEEIELPAREKLLAALGKNAAVNGEVERVGENMPGTVRFLNFKTVHHNDFAVILPLKDGHPEFAREKLNELIGKKIRVTGKISEFHGSPQMIVESPAQIAPVAG
jgi:serine/threonine protein kinase